MKLKINLWKILIWTGVIIYVVSPVDLIPFSPIDDAVVVAIGEMTTNTIKNFLVK